MAMDSAKHERILQFLRRATLEQAGQTGAAN
jgi:hypothetical protein